MDKTVQTENEFEFHFTLTNTNAYPILTDHLPEPRLAIMQNKKELASVSLKNSSEQIMISAGKYATIQLSIPRTQISEDSPVVFYTRTKENIRGELISFLFNNTKNISN